MKIAAHILIEQLGEKFLYQKGQHTWLYNQRTSIFPTMGKLLFYRQIRKNYELQECLNSKFMYKQTKLAYLRISGNPSCIETGGPDTPPPLFLSD